MRRLAPRRRGPPGTPPLRVADVGTGQRARSPSSLAAALRRAARWTSEVIVIAIDVSRGCPRSWRARTRWATASADRMRFAAADLLPSGVDAAVRRDRAPTCPTCATDAMPTLPVADVLRAALALDGGPDGLDVIAAPARPAAARPSRRTASRCSRSAPTRARRSSRGSARGCRAGACRVEPDLAGLPRVARDRAEVRVEPPGRAASGRDPRHRARRSRSACVALDIDGTLVGDDLGRRAATRRRRSARRVRAGVGGLARDRAAWRRARCGSRASSGLDRADHRPPGRARPRDAGGRVDARLGPARSSHTPLAAGRRARGRRLVAASTGSTRTSTTSSGSSSARTTRAPTTTRRSWARGRELVPDLARRRSDHPMTKIIAVGEPPLPTELAPLRAGRASPGRADATVSHPRFLEFVAPGVSKGRAVALARAAAGDPAGQVAGDRRPVERHRDDRRGRATAPRWRRRRPRSRRSPATSRRRRGGGRGAR